MAFTLTQLQALDDAIAAGRLSVSYAGRTVMYQSINQLLEVRRLVRGELIASGQLTEVPNTNRGPSSLAVFSRD